MAARQGKIRILHCVKQGAIGSISGISALCNDAGKIVY